MDDVDDPVDELETADEFDDALNSAVETVDVVVDAPIEVVLPIDGLPAESPRRRVAPAREASHRPIYHRLQYAVHRCDDCMWNHQLDPRAPLALMARYKRVVIGEGIKLLCVEHVQHWRDRDALPPLRIVPPT